MSTVGLPKPLTLSKNAGIPRREIAARVGVSVDWLRHLARNPRHARRVQVAELEAVLEQEKLALSLESILHA